jgi:UDP-glucose 4-epimerase
MASEAFGTKPPSTHLPLWLVKIVAKLDGAISARKGRIPDLELDAVKYLYADYVVDNRKLKDTGYRMIYPDFRQSMKQIGEWHRANVGGR